jgi:hypothetical protein
MKFLMTMLAATTLTAQVAAAQPDPDNYNWPSHPPVKREWPDGPNKQFLQNLQRPDNHKNLHRDENSRSCCDAGDTVKTKFMVESADPELARHPEDRWYAWLKGQMGLDPAGQDRPRLRA